MVLRTEILFEVEGSDPHANKLGWPVSLSEPEN